jgi:nucleoside-diphosphate-sugar epimerase
MVLKGKKVVVTGASGYLARSIMWHLLKEGATVYALSSSRSGRQTKDIEGVKLIHCDLNTATERNISSELRCADLIINTSGLVADSGNIDEFIAANKHSLECLLNVLRTSQSTRLIHLGSVMAYDLSKKPVSEDSPLTTSNAVLYSRTKRMGLEMLSAVAMSLIRTPMLLFIKSS